jgi:hypothetical protein
VEHSAPVQPEEVKSVSTKGKGQSPVPNSVGPIASKEPDESDAMDSGEEAAVIDSPSTNKVDESDVSMEDEGSELKLSDSEDEGSELELSDSETPSEEEEKQVSVDAGDSESDSEADEEKARRSKY